MNTDCKAYCVAEQFRFTALKDELGSRERAVGHRGVLHIQKWEGDALIFDFGVVVTWGMNHDQTQKILDSLRSYAVDPLTAPIEDLFTFEVAERKTTVRDDHITLSNDDALEKIAVSYGIAQSVKLTQFEAQADDAIQTTRHIPQKIADIGTSRLSRKKISKMRGRLFLVSSGITQNVNLLDTPEFFWEYPELEQSYLQMARYLEVRNRLDILEKRLQSIHELLMMLAEEQKHKHSSMLEWVIILLITFEIVVWFFQDFLKWI